MKKLVITASVIGAGVAVLILYKILSQDQVDEEVLLRELGDA